MRNITSLMLIGIGSALFCSGCGDNRIPDKFQDPYSDIVNQNGVTHELQIARDIWWTNEPFRIDHSIINSNNKPETLSASYDPAFDIIIKNWEGNIIYNFEQNPQPRNFNIVVSKNELLRNPKNDTIKNSNSYYWNLKDNQGNPVDTGLYKVMVKSYTDPKTPDLKMHFELKTQKQ